jgi:hypothetical protein
LGLLLRKVWGYCKPRNAKPVAAAGSFAVFVLLALAATLVCPIINLSEGVWRVEYAPLLVTTIAVITNGVYLRLQKICRF